MCLPVTSEVLRDKLLSFDQVLVGVRCRLFVPPQGKCTLFFHVFPPHLKTDKNSATHTDNNIASEKSAIP